MVERKLYKTKLCVLYQKGHCRRQTCSFAHGNSDLRRSFNGRQDYGGRDLREKLDRRQSPVRKYSPPRDARGRHEYHGGSRPRSLGRRSDPKHWKKQQLDGQSDFSGSLKLADGDEDQVIDKKQGSSDSRDILDDQLRQVQSEINFMVDHKRQLELYLEERVQEADSLTSKVQELEMQLLEEKEACKRITSKIKKFVKAYNRHSQLQDELKRSYAQLQKLGEKLNTDVSRPGSNGGDSSINISSDEEPAGNNLTRAHNEQNKNASSSRKRPRIDHEVNRASNQGNPTQGDETVTRKIRSDKLSKWNVRHAQSDSSKKAEVDDNGNKEFRPLASEDNPRRKKNLSTDILFAEKSKPSESGLALPSTSMAAHALDEVVEIVEMEEKFEVIGTASAIAEKEVAVKIQKFPFPPPPPPPIPQHAYLQYKGENKSIDIDGVDEEVADVDII